ncbi:palmitoyltransferase [Plakobranchus ocellatus]|uniref:Palmitoyltransferase n=1 Tax=Plakobranchus ocellatus TaxID=259542 RepID=A0AAV4C9J2_9GAST|nr:palmitoyltransferase [Plakobranchus ocellatus]
MINMQNMMELLPPPPSKDDPNLYMNTLKIPIFGRIQFNRDREGQLLASCVLAYWCYGTFSTLFVILIPAYNDDTVSWPVYYGFILVSFLCLMSFLRSSLTNPGRIPVYSETGADSSNWNKCRSCSRMRPPRAHHCRRCGGYLHQTWHMVNVPFVYPVCQHDVHDDGTILAATRQHSHDDACRNATTPTESYAVMAWLYFGCFLLVDEGHFSLWVLCILSETVYS